MIVATHLAKSYRIGEQIIHAVQDVSLTIEKGAFVSITGHSGSGKTTLLNLLGGLTMPDSGNVKINNIPVWTLKDKALSEFRNRKIGFVFQFASLIPTLTARENILLPVIFGDKVKAKTYKRADELLERVNLSERANAYPAALSGGQQRRIAIARAFINKPSLILADEPTGDLDVDTEAEIIHFFTTMNEEERITFLMVTHNPEIAERAGKRLNMDRGVLQGL